MTKINQNQVTGTALAAHLFCTRETISDYVAKGVIKKLRNGKYDKDESRARVLKHLRDRSAGRTAGGGDAGLAKARAELAREQRDAVRWKNAINRGDLVSAEAVIGRLQNDFMIQRTLLLSWSGKLPHQLAGLNTAEIEAVLEREVYEVLVTLASPETYVESYVGRSADIEDDESAV